MKPQDLNHVVLNVGDADRSEAFYRDLLGFKMTDRFIGGMSIWACNANHHSLAFLQVRDGLPVWFNHAAFDMKDRDAWLNAEVEQLTDPDRQPRLQEPLADLWNSSNRA